MVRVRLEAIAGDRGRHVAVVPRPVREVEPAHVGDRRPGLVGQGFVAGVPDDHARMVPALAHPLCILAGQLILLQLRRPVRPIAVPDRELVLDQDPQLVGNVIPLFGREADAVAQAVPVHVLDPLMEQPHPVRVPGTGLAFAVLEESGRA